MGLICAGYFTINGDLLFGVVIFGICVAGQLLLFVLTWLRNRVMYGDVVVDDDGVEVLVSNRRFRHIRWEEMSRICRIAYFDVDADKNRFEIFFVSDQNLIRIDDHIRGYKSLLNLINQEIERRGIPAFSIDRSVRAPGAQFFAALASSSDNGLPVNFEEGSRVSSF